MHPAQRSNTLTSTQLSTLHTQITTVVNTAVAVNADHALFPNHWLFKYRWGKGRRNEPATFTLPDGTLATVIHQTVGGRTSAIVESVQKLIGQVEEEGGSDVEVEVDGNISGLDEEADVKPKPKLKAKPAKRVRAKAGQKEVKAEDSEEDAATEAPPAKKRGRKAVKKEDPEVQDERDAVPLIVNGASEEIEDDKPAVKVSARKRKVVEDAAEGQRRQKIEVKVETASPRAMRASTRLSKT
jgi:hypothetical protein